MTVYILSYQFLDELIGLIYRHLIPFCKEAVTKRSDARRDARCQLINHPLFIANKNMRPIFLQNIREINLSTQEFLNPNIIFVYKSH